MITGQKTSCSWSITGQLIEIANNAKTGSIELHILTDSGTFVTFVNSRDSSFQESEIGVAVRTLKNEIVTVTGEIKPWNGDCLRKPYWLTASLIVKANVVSGTQEFFTIKEIANVVNDFGYRAITSEADGNIGSINSASSGVPWTIRAALCRPFYSRIFLQVLCWTSEDPLAWINEWNIKHAWSRAYCVIDETSRIPTADDDDEYEIVIEAEYDFTGGIRAEYLHSAIRRWLVTVEKISLCEGLRFLEV